MDVEVVTTVDVVVAAVVTMSCSSDWGSGLFFLGFWKRKILDSIINYWIAIWLYCRSGKSMKIRVMVGLIKICVNMDEEKSKEKQGKMKRKAKKNKGERQGKMEKKKKRERKIN